MAKRVEELDSRKWADGFLTRLGRHSKRDRRRKPPNVEGEVEQRLLRRFAKARTRTVMLDYDGTLRELELHPDLAVPTREIRALLRDLAALPETDVHIVSGRRRSSLEKWFGQLPIHLCAEHGYLARAPGGEWRTLVELDLGWMRPIERLLRRVAADVPGAHVERKAVSVAWHYREAEPEYGSWRAHELLNDLGQHLGGAPAEILQGHRVVEVRARGVDKGVYVRDVFPDGKEASHFVIGIGDDRTDHDLLDALPSGSVAGHVGGSSPEHARRRRPARAHPDRRAGRGARAPARDGRDGRCRPAAARLYDGHGGLAPKRRRVPAGIRLAQLLLVERADAAEELELVAQVRPHHLRAVRGDREGDAVLDEAADRLPHRLLVRQRLGQEFEVGQISRTIPRSRNVAHKPGIAGGEDAVADPLRPQVLDHLGGLLEAHVAAFLPDVDRHAEACVAGGLDHRDDLRVVVAAAAGTRPGDVDPDARLAPPSGSPSPR